MLSVRGFIGKRDIYFAVLSRNKNQPNSFAAFREKSDEPVDLKERSIA